MMESFTFFSHMVENLYGNLHPGHAVSPTPRSHQLPNRKPTPAGTGVLSSLPLFRRAMGPDFRDRRAPEFPDPASSNLRRPHRKYSTSSICHDRRVAATKTTDEWLTLLDAAIIPANALQYDGSRADRSAPWNQVASSRKRIAHAGRPLTAPLNTGHHFSDSPPVSAYPPCLAPDTEDRARKASVSSRLGGPRRHGGPADAAQGSSRSAQSDRQLCKNSPKNMKRAPATTGMHKPVSDRKVAGRSRAIKTACTGH